MRLRPVEGEQRAEGRHEGIGSHPDDEQIVEQADDRAEREETIKTVGRIRALPSPMTLPPITVVRAMTEPTETSIPPTRITKVCPRATIERCGLAEDVEQVRRARGSRGR